MSAGLYASVGGVNRKIKKLYANVNGVNRPIKELWAVKDGVNRKIFSSAVTWTYEVSALNAISGAEVSKVHSLDVWTSNLRGVAWGGKAIYTFPNPLLMRAGQTLDISMSVIGYPSTKDVYITINEALVFEEKILSPNSTTLVTYTFRADIAVNQMLLSIEIGDTSTIYDSMGLNMAVRVNSTDFGSFILNNSGSSDQ